LQNNQVSSQNVFIPSVSLGLHEKTQFSPRAVDRLYFEREESNRAKHKQPASCPPNYIHDCLTDQREADVIREELKYAQPRRILHTWRTTTSAMAPITRITTPAMISADLMFFHWNVRLNLVAARLNLVADCSSVLGLALQCCQSLVSDQHELEAVLHDDDANDLINLGLCLPQLGVVGRSGK
jgi:hypothetical protein